MFELEKKFRFEASHQLPHHDGKCQRLHGHSWIGTAIIQGPDLIGTGPQTGMVMDFGRLSNLLDPLVEGFLDHYHLNDSLGLESPTSEEIARWIYQKLKPSLPELVAIQIEETCTSACTYWGGERWLSNTR